MIWIVVGDSNHCRVYSYQKKPVSLFLLKEIIHDEFRLKKGDFLTTDRPGHYKTKDSGGGAYSPHTDPKEVEFIHFSKEIAEFLDQGRKKNFYNQLIIIAPPHINGLLLQHLNKNVKKLLKNTIKKDYLHTTDQELLTYLYENI